MDNPLPLGFGKLEIDQKANPSTGDAQVIETLRDVLLSEALHTLQFDHEHIFDQDIGIVFSSALTLIADGKRRLASSTDAAYDALRKRVFFICVHPCLSVALVRLVLEEIEDSQQEEIATDKHR